MTCPGLHSGGARIVTQAGLAAKPPPLPTTLKASRHPISFSQSKEGGIIILLLIKDNEDEGGHGHTMGKAWLGVHPSLPDPETLPSPLPQPAPMAQHLPWPHPVWAGLGL